VSFSLRKVTVTCNFVLRSVSLPETYSVFYGQDYSLFDKHKTNLPDEYTVRTFADVGRIPATFDLNNFNTKLKATFKDSKAKVHKIINIVYLIKRTAAQASVNADWDAEVLAQPRKLRGPKHMQIF
jgi:hypothetical protein